MIRAYVIVMSLAACMLSCKPAQQEPVTEPVVAVDTLPAAVPATPDISAWTGTYKGVTPCPDCDGIETTLKLNPDSSYVLQTRYLGTDKTEPIENKGRFRWMTGSNTITLDGLLYMPNQYSIGQNMVIQLDMMGNAITGATAVKYMLMKQTSSKQYISITKE